MPSRLIEFVSKHRYIGKHRSGKEITHTLMDGEGGGCIFLPPEAEEEFLACYGYDLASDGTHYVIERRSTIFKLHFDVDLTTVVDDKRVEDLLRLASEVVGNYFSDGASRNCVCCAIAPRSGGARTHPGLHFVFPHAAVDEDAALWIRAGLVSRCDTDLLWEGVCWSKAIDISVLTATGGLRMVGSDKSKACATCHNHAENRKFCGACSRRGRSAEGKVYWPWKAYPEEAEQLLRDARENLTHGVRLCSTRLSKQTNRNSDFFVPQGAPPRGRKKRARGDPDREFVIEEAEEGVVPKVRRSAFSPVALTDKSRSALQEFARNFHSAYSDVTVKNVEQWASKHSKSFVLKLSGFGSRFCLNKGAAHMSQTVYLVVNRITVTQRCFSRKDMVRQFGKCSDFQSLPQKTPPSLLNLLYGEVELPKIPLMNDVRVQALFLSRNQQLQKIPLDFSAERYVDSNEVRAREPRLC